MLDRVLVLERVGSHEVAKARRHEGNTKEWKRVFTAEAQRARRIKLLVGGWRFLVASISLWFSI
jgi:hypothetical protein